jgi:hypothetical protein
MAMLKHLRLFGLVTLAAACGNADLPSTPKNSLQPALAQDALRAVANGSYHFTIPEDFNGGIFGIEIENDVSFTVRRSANGEVGGRFRYVQSAGGEDFIFSGSVTCFQRYDTPVLARFPEIPAMVGNRAKWGGVIEASNDPTIPVGRYLWFQSIDNSGEPGSHYPDVSTLSGFGDEAATLAFCNSPNVPNANFGPHAVGAGQIIVQ